jgi:RNA-binding protein
MSLTSKQRAYLKSLAHPLSPVVRVGRARISPEVVSETLRSMEAHELIKVRIESEESKERRQIAADLALQTESHLVGTVGKIAILYRPRQEKPTIKLPDIRQK